MPGELAGNLIDAVSNDQYGSVGSLRQKVSQRPIETSDEHHALAFLRNEGEGAGDLEYSVGITSEQPAPCLRFVDLPQSLGLS